MTVEIVSLQGSGGKIVKSFADTLLAPDQPQAMGDLWYTTFNLINASGTAGVTISQGLNRTASGLVFTNGTGAGYLPTAIVIPVRLTFDYVSIRSQFVQFVWVGSVGIADLDMMLFCTQNQFAFYGANIISNTNQISALRRTSGGNTGLIAAGPATAFNNGDTLRFEAINTVPGQTTINIKISGVLAATFVDNSVSRFSVGMPGLYFNGSNPAASITIKNFLCGTL